MSFATTAQFFLLFIANFLEAFFDKTANQAFSDYVADRVHRRVRDTKTGLKLIPKDHSFGMQRLPLETKYFEVYNRDNVELFDVTETPIERVTRLGIRTKSGHYDLDMIIYATGFTA
jgi:cation diffusion facilitator CzcD-associated flavoprotein CzcO